MNYAALHRFPHIVFYFLTENFNFCDQEHGTWKLHFKAFNTYLIVIILRIPALQGWNLKILVYTASRWGFGPGHHLCIGQLET